MNGISVIIPTLNRTNFLVNTIEDLLLQECSFPFEIIVVDQSNQEDKYIIDMANNNKII